MKAGLFGAALALFGSAQAQVSVTASAGDLGPTNYATVNAAIAAVNAGTPQGAIVITVTASTTEPAPATALLRSNAPSSYTSVLLTCTGNVTVNSAATPTGSRGIIELLGADNVTIDGDDPGTVGTRNLTIQMATNATTGTQCIRLASNSTTGLDGADNNTVRNCNIIGGRASETSTTSSWGILMGNTASGTGGAYSSLNTLIENNEITRCHTGIGAIGVSATYLNAGTIIRNNTIGSATSANNIGLRGINISYSASTAGVGSATIRNNDIRAGSYGTGYSTTIAGIEAGTVNAGLLIDRNTIHDINQPSTGGYGAHGIYITGSATNAGITITNNFIRDCKMVVYQTSKISTFIPCGVFFTAGATLVNFDHNTVSMGTQLGAGANFSSFAMNASVSGVTFASFRNNILRNTHVSTNAYGFNTAATTNISGGAVDNNDYYVPGGHVGFYSAANQTTLGAWQGATGKDAASINLDPPFVSATDLHIQTTPAVPALPFYQTGANGTGVTADYDNEARATPPCIGADEFVLPTCSSAIAGSVTGNGNACDLASNVLSLSGATSGLGVTYQWAYGAVGGPYSNLLGTNATQNTSGIPVGTWEVVCTLTCANCGPCDNTTAAFPLTVNGLPTVAVDVPSSNYCVGNTAIAVTASGASTYAWSPAAGLSATTGATVNAGPSATTTYTVSGTDGNGCVNTATSAITVLGNAPVISSVTANPNPTCFNGNSQLNVAANIPATVNQYAFANTIGTFNSIVGGPGTVQINTGADDTNYGPYALGFSFNFNGTTYTTAGVNANGFVTMGAAPTSSYTALSSGTSNNVIAALNNDLLGLLANGSTMVRQLSGAPGSQVFTFEWFNWGIYNAGAANNEFSFQVKLYEGTNVIEFVYQNGPATGSINAQVGLRGSSNAVYSNRETLTDWTATTAGGTNAVTCAITASVRPVNGLTFTWTPPTPTYLWTPNTFLNFDNIANPLASAINVASQAYTVTAMAASGCTSTGTVTVTTSAPITAATITGNLAYCFGGSTTLTAVPTDGAGPYTYLWSPGGAVTASLVVTAAGSYSCQVTDNCGGSVNTGNVSVTENALPTVAVAPTSSNYCTGYPAVALAASGADTYAWLPALGLDATNVANVNASPAATTTYTVTGTTTATGCTNTATSTITVLGAAPVITSTTAVSPICPGSTSQLQVNTPSPSAYCNSAFTNVTYEFLTNVTFAGINNTSIGNTGGPVNYTAQVASVTAGSPYNLDVTMDPDASDYIYAWFDWNQNGLFTDLGEGFTVVANVGTAGPHTVSIPVPVGAINGNTRMRVMVDYNNATPNPCRSATYGEAEDYTVNVSGGASAYTYAWTPAGNLSNAAIANPVATLTTGEAYTVTVTNAAGCSAQGNTSVTVSGPVDDGDPCTLDACLNGVITHTFQDADGDLICDANDPCPNLANLVNGDPCDDGNVCTINDIVTLCVCAGTFQDTDGDLTCDANDGCPIDPLKIAAGQCGCGVPDTDTDGDLTADCVDGCINDPLKTAPGICGCGVSDVDTDGDLTVDCLDGCPNDPLKIAPGICGCGVADTDTDGDLTADCLDGCPADPLKIAPGQCGCGNLDTDTDGDLTADCVDGCPIDPNKTAAGQCGCGIPDTDTDGDLTADCNDGCINDPLKTAPGLCGCGIPEGTCNDCLGVPAGPAQPGTGCDDLDACTINDLWSPLCVCVGTFQDTDGDLTCDANDGCPLDANKIAPGQCGCGVADTDTDGDLTADCNDGCINDPLKTAPGICGCGTADTDTDGDLTADCNDGCINDPLKIAPGQCGCGIPDTDTDGDLTADCNDGCINDPLKTAPGICGCGIADTDTDGDLTADCNDGCINDPNKIAPGICGCGVADTDTDGDLLADCIDNCPLVSGVQGDPCTDGDVCTVGDALNASCVCVGTYLDTDGDGTCDANDNCPLVVGQQGSACNDGDVDTYGDVLDANCVCVGIPCAQNGVKLTFNTDASAAQITWFIKNTGTNVSVCTGSGLPNSSTITVNCCLADGCYDLEVTDAFGDGINPGGYVLRTATGERIIDNASNGQTFSSVSKSALGFCVPLSAEAFVPTSCDNENATLSTVLQAQPNAVITAFPTPQNLSQQGFYGYQYWLTNPHGGYSRRILLTLGAPGSAWPGGTPTGLKPTYFALSSINQSAPFIPRDILLNVRVRAYIAGVYGNFGPACRLRVPTPPCTISQLTTTATPVVSCGATGLTLGSTIYADAVVGGTNYQFEFSKVGYLRRITQPVRSTALSFVTSPLQNNNCYNVRVRVSTDGGLTFCPFGPVCTITVGIATCGGAMAPQPDENTADIAISTRLTMWPNPNDGSTVNISFTDLDAGLTTVTMDVTDLYGKLITTRTIPAGSSYLNTVIAFEQDLAPGMYLVNLQAGEQRFTERLMIQR